MVYFVVDVDFSVVEIMLVVILYFWVIDKVFCEVGGGMVNLWIGVYGFGFICCLVGVLGFVSFIWLVEFMGWWEFRIY